MNLTAERQTPIRGHPRTFRLHTARIAAQILYWVMALRHMARGVRAIWSA